MPCTCPTVSTYHVTRPTYLQGLMRDWFTSSLAELRGTGGFDCTPGSQSSHMRFAALLGDDLDALNVAKLLAGLGRGNNLRLCLVQRSATVCRHRLQH
jgi:hypothetical protein